MRTIRACAELGIESVAVYPIATRCTSKRPTKPAIISPATSNPHQLVNLAVASGCDALHPGFGLLSGDPLFAGVRAKRGIRFTNPNARLIRQIGDKIAARQAMIRAASRWYPALTTIWKAWKKRMLAARIDPQILEYPDFQSGRLIIGFVKPPNS